MNIGKVGETSVSFEGDLTIRRDVKIEAVDDLENAMDLLEARVRELENRPPAELMDFSNVTQHVVPFFPTSTDIGRQDRPFREGYIARLTVRELEGGGYDRSIRFAPGTTLDLRGITVLADDIALTKKDMC